MNSGGNKPWTLFLNRKGKSKPILGQLLYLKKYIKKSNKIQIEQWKFDMIFFYGSIVWKSVPHISQYLINYYFASIKWGLKLCITFRELKKKDFFQYLLQYELRIVRQWHHLTNFLHIHIDVLQNVLWKSMHLQNLTTSLLLSNFHQIFTNLFIFFSLFIEINLNLDWILPLKFS